jgi:hypothetical protein
MGLFDSKADKRAKAAAAQAESERLLALPVRALAAEVMRAFGPNGINAKSGHRQGPMEVVSWLLPDAPVKYRQPILGPVIEALGVLESANLLTRRSFGSTGRASTYHTSRLGETAMAEGAVGKQLGIEML